MNFRKLEKRDEEQYLQLVWDFYHSSAVLHPVDKQYHVNTFNEIMRSNEYLECFVFEDDDKLVGFALLSKSFSPEVGGKIVWIEEIYILEQYRGMGLGTKFFEFLHKNIPASRYRLEIEPDNERAKELYSRLGYNELGYMQMVKDE